MPLLSTLSENVKHVLYLPLGVLCFRMALNKKQTAEKRLGRPLRGTTFETYGEGGSWVSQS
eukprot:scaffold1834_cov175-Amphora_coffeaeformis.AAC.14